MAKTINKDIDIFNSEEAARKAFKKTTSSQLLYAKGYKSWYVDKSKTALGEWPTLYTLVDEK
jgi:hypothetical protein